MPKLAWKTGEPDGPGLWIVQFVYGDFDAWIVDWAIDDETNCRYLEFDDRETCEAIAGYPYPPVRSFGPIPHPKSVTDKMRENYRKLMTERNERRGAY